MLLLPALLLFIFGGIFIVGGVTSSLGVITAIGVAFVLGALAAVYVAIWYARQQSEATPLA